MTSTSDLVTGSLLAFGRNKDLYPNFEALMLSPRVGWALWIALAGLLAFFLAHREKWRRLWLQMGDPRSVALFRIVFGLFTLFNVNGLWEHFEFLFTDQGIFPTDVAQQVRAKSQFIGYGDGSTPGEALGFFGWEGFWNWVKGPNHSLLLLDGSPGFFWAHIVVFELSMVAFIVGLWTKYTKWIAWIAFHSIIMRNTMYWEGTENVYRAFFFYLALSRCGAAYSVDNWWRCRKLRKAGRLSEPGGPGDGAGLPESDRHPKGLEAIYRAIPMWPRWLMVIQTAIVYGYAGPTKNGHVWRKGDAFYYAFNLDHFYRVPPQELSAIFGTNLFRVNSFVVHYWQMFFPLVVVGLILRWVRAERFEPLSVGQRRLAHLGMFAFAAGIVAAVIIAYPVHYKAPKGGLSITAVQCLVGVLAPLGLGLLYGFGWRLRHRPFQLRVRGRRFQIDVAWFCRWVLGRRLWLGLGLIFHSHLVILMNIGWFNPGLASSYIAYLNGGELASLGCAFRRAFAKLRGASAAEIGAIRPVPPEDPRRLSVGDGTRLRLGVLAGAAAIAMGGVVVHVLTVPDMWDVVGRWASRQRGFELPPALVEQGPAIGAGWFLLAAFGVLVGATWVGRRRAGGSSNTNESVTEVHYPWAYGPWGRLLAGSVVVYHLAGLTAWMLPEKDSMATFRMEARKPFKWWLQNTQTTQSWSMFAPNPPRSNMFLRVLVHGQDGETWDLNTDVYACLEEGATPELCEAVFPRPWIWYSRQRKMNRRIAGGEGGHGAWYQKWYARWQCREWALTHGGELPKSVELVKVTYPIPSPDYVAKHGAYDPRTQYRSKGHQKSLYTETCARAPYGQPSRAQLMRAGIDPAQAPEQKTWRKNRCRGWTRHLEREKGRAPETVACMLEDGQ